MKNNLIRIKVYERLNKLASFDYDNIECWQIAEAFNKAQREWYRRQVHGVNALKETAEESIVSIDDLQRFIRSKELLGTNKDKAFDTVTIPSDYFHFIRLTAYADNGKCKNREMTVYMGEEANVDVLLTDTLKGPDFDWAETFATMHDNKFSIYTNDKFVITKSKLHYYKKPADISFDGCVDPGTGATTGDVECEFRDGVVEMIIDEAVAILAGDIESFNQYQRNLQNGQRNT